MLPLEYWIIVLTTAIAVVVCVVLHYEGLRLLNRIPVVGIRGRRRLIYMILGILILHTVEIWIFGMSYFWLLREGGFGELNGIHAADIFDCVYFSATVFTTLGFGDIIPTGPIRFITGTESLAGLTLITWSASFTFVEMMKSGMGHDE